MKPLTCLVLTVIAVVVFLTLHGTSKTPPMSAEPSPRASASAPAFLYLHKPNRPRGD